MTNENSTGRTHHHLLMQIIGSMLSGTTDNANLVENLTRDAIIPVSNLAKKHDLAHIVARFISQNGIDVDPTLNDKLQREDYLAAYRNRQMGYTYGEICSAFDEAGIDYLPLKGSLIRPFYPYESMRTSCDIDILVKEGDVDAAVACLVARGYTAGERNYHDVSVYSPSKIHLELHFSILENIDSLDSVLADVWKYAKVGAGHRYELSPEFLYYHFTAHMAYHFLAGGCGIKSLMDLWILEHRMGLKVENAKELLEKGGIYKFALQMQEIANKCFAGEGLDEFSEKIFGYICGGGVYGNAENKIAVHRRGNKGTLSYIIYRLFPPYRVIVHSYPVLKKAPILLPFCWVARWIRALFKGKASTLASQVSVSAGITDEKIKEVGDICTRLGL